MKWAYHIRHKIKAVCFLTGIMAVILLSNITERNSFSDLDDSMSSIYNDRLKPATYLFEISNNLYGKRLLHDDNIQHAPAELPALVKKHNEAIALLVKEYETTMLTKEEQQEWTTFKTRLDAYNTLEHEWLKMHAMNSNPAQSVHEEIDRHFNSTMQTLHSLSRIQVGEGNNLRKSTHSIISSTLLLSYLEISMLIILGLFTLIILSTSDNTIFRQQQNQALN